jgi:hypothetical protein
VWIVEGTVEVAVAWKTHPGEDRAKQAATTKTRVTGFFVMLQLEADVPNDFILL